jgi:threonine aldolase
MPVIDLRSDTVTKPTPRMREAMATAEVGDDVYQEDPTVNRLQQRAAELFDREAALFVPTGSMGNLIAVKLHTQPGEEVIIEGRGHILNYEVSSLSSIAGVMPRAIASNDGLLEWDQIAAAIRPPIYYCAKTTLLCLENTHNMAGGTVYSKQQMATICTHAHQHGLRVHLDGARIFNAAAALDESVADLTRPFDSIMFCLSKGLGAPVGSMLLGSREFIDRAWRVRKMFGGGMRQVGVIAAAGLVALVDSPALLATDHANAKFLAHSLAEIPGIQIEPEKVTTNIIIFDISRTGFDTGEFSRLLHQRGILANGINMRQMRMLTHYDVSREDCQRAIHIIQDIVAENTR